jgi:hypothetical protein
MNENLKIIGIIVIIVILSAILSFGLFFTIKHYEKTYKVEITFCDGRPPIVTTVKDLGEPSRYSIENYKRGVPEYKGYLNVCDVKVVK